MELASSDAAAVLFFLKKEKEKNGGAKRNRAGNARPYTHKRSCGAKSQNRADEYPQGAGRICNAPSSRTAALGIGPYNHDRKCGTRSKKRADRVVRPYKRCGVNRKSGQGVCPCNTKTQPSSMDGCVLIWDVIRPSVCRKSSCAWAARPRRLRLRACAAAPSALWSASSASRRRR